MYGNDEAPQQVRHPKKSPNIRQALSLRGRTWVEYSDAEQQRGDRPIESGSTRIDDSGFDLPTDDDANPDWD